MTNKLMEVTEFNKRLALAETPKEAGALELIAVANRAMAKELGIYEQTVKWAHEYILARRKTTELIEPNIVKFHGNRFVGGNDMVTSYLADYGFTKQQWFRRKQEINDISISDINDYIDDCIEKRTEPTTYGLVRFMKKPHVTNNSGENEWYTPKEYIDAARYAMGSIDVDPASSDIANETVKAEAYYTIENDGLDREWGGNVWMNPPYSQPIINDFIKGFVERFAQGEIKQGCVLVNNATETGWYQLLLSSCFAVCFIRGRIRFIDKYGTPSGAPLQGQTILYYGDNIQKFADAFYNFGTVLYAK